MLPRSLTQPLRQGQLTVGAGWRAYFAPFNQALAVTTSSTLSGPTIYDLQVFAKFLDANFSPVAGWYDLAYTDNFKFTPGSKMGNVVTGYRGAIRAKYRAEVSEKLSFEFQEVSRLTLGISTGMQIFNLLATTASASTVGPLSASGTPAIPIGASGYSATGWAGATSGLPTLAVPAGSGALFPAQTMIVCDQDYSTSNFGFVGDAGANVFQGAVTNVDFTRMTSDYVNRVVQVIPAASSGLTGQDALILSAVFVGGGNNPLGAATVAPTAGAKVQAINGYAAREGGTYIREWSAIFALDTVDGSQILKYYPRVAPDTSAGMPSKALAGATSLQQTGLSCALDAMAFDDPLDGETVVSYTAYFPHADTTPQI
jgi:hypothetical protein